MPDRRMRKQPIATRNLVGGNFDLEDGDRVISAIDGRVYDLRASRGNDKAASGELTPVLASAQRNGAKPVCIDGTWHWRRDDA